MPYNYFVVFDKISDSGFGTYNTSVELKVPITSLKQVRAIEAEMKKRFPPDPTLQCVVTWYDLWDSEEIREDESVIYE